MAKNIDFMGAVFPDVPSVKLPQQGGGLVAFDDTTDATATADKILSGYTAYANGQKLTGTASGGITPSGTYSITSNGIYDIVSFASVDVQVSGGGGGGYTADEIAMKTISGVVSGSATEIKPHAFYQCSAITAVYFPDVTKIQSEAFINCSALSTISFPNVTSIMSSAFYGCSSLMSVYLLGSKSANLTSKDAFTATPISNSTYTGSFGSIYVPASLVNTYKAKARWSIYADRITSYVE